MRPDLWFRAALIASCCFSGASVRADILSSIKGTSPQLIGELHTGLAMSSLEEAKALVARGDIVGAKGVVEKARSTFPDLPLTELLIAGWFFDLNQPAIGAKVMESIAASKPPRRDIHVQFAKFALAQSRLFEATMHIERARSLANEPEWSKAYGEHLENMMLEMQATIADRRGEWKESERLYTDLSSKFPLSPLARIGIARAVFMQGDVAKAESILREVELLAGTPLSPTELVLASYCEAKKDLNGAEEWLKKGMERKDNELIRREYAKLLIRQNRPVEAKELASREKPSEEQKAEFAYVIALSEQMLGDFSAAEAIFTRLYESKPDSFPISNSLIWCLVQSEDESKMRKALDLAESNFRKNPIAIEAVSTLAWVKLKIGDAADAATTFERPTTNRNLSRDAAYFLAKIKEANGKTEEARAILEGTLRAEGEFYHASLVKKASE